MIGIAMEIHRGRGSAGPTPPYQSRLGPSTFSFHFFALVLSLFFLSSLLATVRPLPWLRLQRGLRHRDGGKRGDRAEALLGGGHQELALLLVRLHLPSTPSRATGEEACCAWALAVPVGSHGVSCAASSVSLPPPGLPLGQLLAPNPSRKDLARTQTLGFALPGADSLLIREIFPFLQRRIVHLTTHLLLLVTGAPHLCSTVRSIAHRWTASGCCY